MRQKHKLAIIQWGSYRSFPVGGISTFVESILPSLAEVFDLKLVGMSMGEPIGLWTQIEVNGRTFDFLPVVDSHQSKMIPDRLRLCWAVKKHRHALSEANADAYYVHMTEAAIPLISGEAPVIIHVHGLYNLFQFSRHFLGTPFSMLYERIYPALFSRCSRVIGVGVPEDFDRFCRTMRVQAGALIPTCVRRHIFRPLDRSEIRRRLGIDERDKVLLYVGRLTDTKNPLLILQAAEIVRRLFPDLKLVFAGDGPLRSEILTRSESIPGVISTGRLLAEETALWMNVADVVTIASKTEAFPIVALEALSCGTPVVATPVSVLPDIIKNGVNGWISSDFSPESYAAAIESALKLPASRECCAQSVNEYSSETIASRVSLEIESAISAHNSDSSLAKKGLGSSLETAHGLPGQSR